MFLSISFVCFRSLRYLCSMIFYFSGTGNTRWAAKQLAAATEERLLFITEEMNFPNQSFLGKYFKEHVGMSPSAYRKR